MARAKTIAEMRGLNTGNLLNGIYVFIVQTMCPEWNVHVANDNFMESAGKFTDAFNQEANKQTCFICQ